MASCRPRWATRRALSVSHASKTMSSPGRLHRGLDSSASVGSRAEARHNSGWPRSSRTLRPDQTPRPSTPSLAARRSAPHASRSALRTSCLALRASRSARGADIAQPPPVQSDSACCRYRALMAVIHSTASWSLSSSIFDLAYYRRFYRQPNGPRIALGTLSGSIIGPSFQHNS